MMQPQLFKVFFQFVDGNAAHFRSASSRNRAGGKVQIEDRGGKFGILTIDFKEIAHLEQDDIIRVVMFGIVI